MDPRPTWVIQFNEALGPLSEALVLDTERFRSIVAEWEPVLKEALVQDLARLSRKL